MPLQIKIRCTRCGTTTLLQPGAAPAPLCDTCLRKFGGLHPHTIHANEAYRRFKERHGISAETGRRLNPIERGAAVFLRRQRRVR